MRFSTIIPTALVAFSASAYGSPVASQEVEKRTFGGSCTTGHSGVDSALSSIMGSIQGGKYGSTNWGSMISQYTGGMSLDSPFSQAALGQVESLAASLSAGSNLGFSGELTNSLKNLTTQFSGDSSITDPLHSAIAIVGQLDGMYGSFSSGNAGASGSIQSLSQVFAQVEGIASGFGGFSGGANANGFAGILTNLAGTSKHLLVNFNGNGMVSSTGTLNQLTGMYGSCHALGRAFAGNSGFLTGSPSLNLQGMLGKAIGFLNA
ncbi:hypothetical protein F4780DRAFT_587671 [Xylariomycetidae sp. FL0641]|nr:hypothetical protein F4780DRAFT_587671 [Xylariomycetidae sp. FL0641]